MGQKRCYFEKQTGEVIENKGKGYMDSQKQTGKQTGEVVENASLWKKLSGNEPKTKRAKLLKIIGHKTSRDSTISPGALGAVPAFYATNDQSQDSRCSTAPAARAFR